MTWWLIFFIVPIITFMWTERTTRLLKEEDDYDDPLGYYP